MRLATVLRATCADAGSLGTYAGTIPHVQAALSIVICIALPIMASSLAQLGLDHAGMHTPSHASHRSIPVHTGPTKPRRSRRISWGLMAFSSLLVLLGFHQLIVYEQSPERQARRLART